MVINMDGNQNNLQTEPQNTSVLKNLDFMKVLSGGLISDIGTNFSFIALLFLAVRIGESNGASTGEIAASIALITVFQLIPSILIGPFAGVFVDRFDRKKIMIVSDILGGVTALIMTIVTELWQIYSFIVLFAIVRLFFYPARGAAFPLIVDKTQLVQANGMVQITAQISRMLGPALAGLVIASQGYKNAFFIDSASYLFSAVMIFLIQANLNVEDKKEAMTVKNTVIDLKQGFGLTFRDNVIGYLVGLFMFTLFMIGFIDPLFVVYLTQYFGLGEIDFGYILSLSSIAGFLGAIILTTMGKNLRKKISFITSAVLVLGISTILIAMGAFLNSVFFLYTGMIMLGLINVLAMIPLNALLQAIIDPKHLGKVSAFFSTSFVIAQLTGALIATQIVKFIGIDLIYLGAGIILTFFSILAFLFVYQKNIESIAQEREADALSEKDIVGIKDKELETAPTIIAD